MGYNAMNWHIAPHCTYSWNMYVYIRIYVWGYVPWLIYCIIYYNYIVTELLCRLLEVVWSGLHFAVTQRVGVTFPRLPRDTLMSVRGGVCCLVHPIQVDFKAATKPPTTRVTHCTVRRRMCIIITISGGEFGSIMIIQATFIQSTGRRIPSNV